MNWIWIFCVLHLKFAYLFGILYVAISIKYWISMQFSLADGNLGLNSKPFKKQLRCELVLFAMSINGHFIYLFILINFVRKFVT